jgi:arsenate reductase-like glutaredoxin family protein
MLEQWIEEDHLDDFINRRSPSYKELGLDQKTLTKRMAIDYMMQDPNLIKRPIILSGRKRLFGFLPDEYEKVTGE